MLDHSSPHEKLFFKAPYYTTLRVFGCKCFPLFRPYTAHKLEYRSKACIFLGYSHAGYWCLDPLTERVYLSRHVVFDEQSFPAKDYARVNLPSKVNASSDVPFIFPINSSEYISLSHPTTATLNPITLQHSETPLDNVPPPIVEPPINEPLDITAHTGSPIHVLSPPPIDEPTSHTYSISSHDPSSLSHLSPSSSVARPSQSTTFL